MMFVFLCLTYFTKHNTFQVHRHCCEWQNISIVFNVYYIFCIHSSVNGQVCPFHILAIVNSGAMNIGMHVSFQSSVFLFFRYIQPGVELLDHMVVLFLVFWGTSIIFFIVGPPVYSHINSVHGFPFIHILTNISYSQTFSDRCQVISHCGFDLHFSDDE